MSADLFVSPRRRKVEHLLRSCGVTDARVLGAILAVPRELFVSSRDPEPTVPSPYDLAIRLNSLQLCATGYSRITIGVGTGPEWPEHGPFDAVIVTGAGV